MSIFGSDKWVEYTCTHCGAKSQRHEGTGRPSPGTCFGRGRTKDGRAKPHVWVISRRY